MVSKRCEEVSLGVLAKVCKLISPRQMAKVERENMINPGHN